MQHGFLGKGAGLVVDRQADISPLVQIGVDECSPKSVGAFFDIVDYDEGTCGRRRLRLGVFGLEDVV